MNNLKDIILEKLIINKNIKITHKEYDERYDYKINVINKITKKPYQWFNWWKYLWDNGPMTKQELVYDRFGLNTSSKYAETFTWLRKHNIIVYNRKLKVLEPIDPEEWKN